MLGKDPGWFPRGIAMALPSRPLPRKPKPIFFPGTGKEGEVGTHGTSRDIAILTFDVLRWIG